MQQYEKSWLIGSRGIRLYVRRSQPKGSSIAELLLVHGLGEHSRRYDHVVDELTKAGVRVHTLDLRGHGRSDGNRGDVLTYGDWLDDIEALWKDLPDSANSRFLYGHSLGGQLVANFMLDRLPDQSGLSGAIITSPWFELAVAPPWIKLLIARGLRHVFPSFTQSTGLKLHRFSRDIDFLKTFEDLDLTHRKISTRAYFAIEEGARRAREEARRLTCPLLLIHGAKDDVTSPKATEEFFKNVSSRDKTLRILPECLHETHNELERADVIAEIVRWVTQRAGAPRA